MFEKLRLEEDCIGQIEVPENDLYGIHSVRALRNFPNSIPFHREWYEAMGVVKLSCYFTYKKFKNEALKTYRDKLPDFRFLSDDVLESLIRSATLLSGGKWFEHFIVPAIQGGAGTSINMNVNEILANASLIDLGEKPGEYSIIDPIENANIFQSTNDVVPTALKIAVMKLLLKLEVVINEHRVEIEHVEGKCRNVLRQGYTQMQEAVPSSYDKLFSSYNNALSRDWWRVSKCLERIKEVNLGGGAIGTGLSIPRFFIMNVVSELQKLTNLPVTRSENLSDNTANLDSFVEVHSTLKAHAVNLEKMVSDIRLMGADLFKNREVFLPEKQVGSSIMPGKVNPVIPEFVISLVHRVYSNDLLISNLCGQGCLDLNAYLPAIGHALIESIKLLINANETCAQNLLSGLKIPEKTELSSPIFFNPSVTTALSPFIGYNKASLLAKEMKSKCCSVFEANIRLNIIEQKELEDILNPQNILKLGFSLKDIR
ncbi:MAG: aspartate ammonia-lyase [Marinilabiliaceae bacterium]|nr:aspartate ammonia-lyase [Marinilabiliaceae bacterium]